MAHVVANQVTCFDPASDAALLARFVEDRDERAFCALVERHGALVLGVCRRVLGLYHDAEDAFQATFVLLARQAATVRDPDRLGPWLARVAFRVSLRARRRRRHMASLDGLDPALDDWLDRADRRDRLRVLDEELQALSRNHREALVLCYLEGCTRDEAARRLGTSEIVIKGRLQRGRRELRARLVARGAGVCAVAALLQASQGEAAAALSEPLLATTIAAATANAAHAAAGNSHLILSTQGLAQMPLTTLCGFALAGLLLLGANPPTTHPPLAVSAAMARDLSAAPATNDDELALAAAPQGANNQRGDAAATDRPAGLLGYGDDKPDGRKSIAGTGQMIQFERPADARQLTGIRLHGSRYGYPKPPQEDFVVYVLSADGKEALHEEKFPYSRFERGDSKWVNLKFKKPVELPEQFWIVVNFNAERTKGVYVSYDTSTAGKHSKTGLPGEEPADVDFAGDWMIEAATK